MSHAWGNQLPISQMFIDVINRVTYAVLNAMDDFYFN